ncbi:heparin lyase I family protein [Planktotalea sp.]|uniref:heparin lyase I family protein n=1 Tax=Planktotalea sp. TaxID=2029877 RepID=UPI0032983B03
MKILTSLVFLLFLSACQPVDPVQQQINSSIEFAPPTGFTRAFSPKPYNFTRAYATQGKPVRFGEYSERFELRDGDCDVTNCSSPRARAEIQRDADFIKANVGDDIWYAWSFYNQSIPSFTAKNSLRLVFGQWTMGGQRPAIFRLMQVGQDEVNFAGCDPTVCSNIFPVRGDVVLQLDDIAKTYKWGESQNNGNICRLFDMTAARGQWVDLTVNTNFSTGDDGYLRVWVNGQLVCSYSGPIVSQASVLERSGNKPEHRRGIFSTWTNRWKGATGGAAIPTMVAYYDGFRFGSSFAEVNAPFDQDGQTEQSSNSLATRPDNSEKAGAFAKGAAQLFKKSIFPRF